MFILFELTSVNWAQAVICMIWLHAFPMELLPTCGIVISNFYHTDVSNVQGIKQCCTKTKQQSVVHIQRISVLRQRQQPVECRGLLAGGWCLLPQGLGHFTSMAQLMSAIQFLLIFVLWVLTSSCSLALLLFLLSSSCAVYALWLLCSSCSLKFCHRRISILKEVGCKVIMR